MKKVFYPLFFLFLVTATLHAKTLNILAFGDSITYGNGATRQQSYPAQLQKISQQHVFNAGISGEESTEGVQRLKKLLKAYKKIDIIILCHGANDILRHKSKQILEKNIQTMIKLAQSKKIKVLLIGVVDFNFQNLQTVPLYKKLAKKYHTAYNGEILQSIEENPKLKSDAIHPNAQGYKKMAQAIFASLQKANFLK